MNEPQTQALELAKPQAVARASDNPLGSVNIHALLERAVDSKMAVESFRELVALNREMQDRRAKESFDEAMSAFQSRCPVITKSKAVVAGGKAAYSYAPIEAIEVQIRPLLREYGFSHTFDTDTASEKGWVIAKCIVTHRDGHSRPSTAKFPLGTKTAIMSDTQQYAAALTFANRRALCNAYGLILAGEDLDGMLTKTKPPGPSTMQPAEQTVKELARELWGVLCKICAGDKNWNRANQWMWDEGILTPDESAPNLPTARFKAVIAKAKEKLSHA